MLQHLPAWLGEALASFRSGAGKLAIAKLGGDQPDLRSIRLTSTAFADGSRIPERYTADGEGVSPALSWGPLPAGTKSLALLVEDADAPTPKPLVHALVWDIDPERHELDEGEIGSKGDGKAGGASPEAGRNSYQLRGWLPPDPPPGHGEHRYVFQLFALSQAPELGSSPGRSALIEAIRPRLLAAAVLTGTYSRSDPAAAGPAAAASPQR
jgi:Raf kinase inhibitor-like YbhB/YbcL family protein